MRSVIACFLVAMIATPAAADWQYARWGMTTGQVIKASKGEARSYRAGEDFACGYVGETQLAIVPQKEIGGMLFKVTFCSTTKADHLGAINLGSSTANSAAVKRALLAQYGQPISDRSNQTVWRDPKGKNTITFSSFGGVVSHIDYKPLGGSGF
jgi:hypothetical protein